MMAHVGAIASATDLPAFGDLENGFGDDPETVADTILAAAPDWSGARSRLDQSSRSPDLRHGLAIERMSRGRWARLLPFLSP
jgi:hypothetical protein